MRLIILTLAALSAMAVAERNLCAKEEKICPGGSKPRTPCADSRYLYGYGLGYHGLGARVYYGRSLGSKTRGVIGCADGSKPVRQCAKGKPHCPWTTKNRRKV